MILRFRLVNGQTRKAARDRERPIYRICSQDGYICLDLAGEFGTTFIQCATRWQNTPRKACRNISWVETDVQTWGMLIALKVREWIRPHIKHHAGRRHCAPRRQPKKGTSLEVPFAGNKKKKKKSAARKHCRQSWRAATCSKVRRHRCRVRGRPRLRTGTHSFDTPSTVTQG